MECNMEDERKNVAKVVEQMGELGERFFVITVVGNMHHLVLGSLVLVV